MKVRMIRFALVMLLAVPRANAAHSATEPSSSPTFPSSPMRIPKSFASSLRINGIVGSTCSADVR
jgi:hypothetical protein